MSGNPDFWNSGWDFQLQQLLEELQDSTDRPKLVLCVHNPGVLVEGFHLGVFLRTREFEGWKSPLG